MTIRSKDHAQRLRELATPNLAQVAVKAGAKTVREAGPEVGAADIAVTTSPRRPTRSVSMSTLKSPRAQPWVAAIGEPSVSMADHSDDHAYVMSYLGDMMSHVMCSIGSDPRVAPATASEKRHQSPQQPAVELPPASPLLKGQTMSVGALAASVSLSATVGPVAMLRGEAEHDAESMLPLGGSGGARASGAPAARGAFDAAEVVERIETDFIEAMAAARDSAASRATAQAAMWLRGLGGAPQHHREQLQQMSMHAQWTARVHVTGGAPSAGDKRPRVDDQAPLLSQPSPAPPSVGSLPLSASLGPLSTPLAGTAATPQAATGSSSSPWSSLPVAQGRPSLGGMLPLSAGGSAPAAAPPVRGTPLQSSPLSTLFPASPRQST